MSSLSRSAPVVSQGLDSWSYPATSSFHRAMGRSQDYTLCSVVAIPFPLGFGSGDLDDERKIEICKVGQVVANRKDRMSSKLDTRVSTENEVSYDRGYFRVGALWR